MQWKQKLQSDISVAGVEAGGNKLRTYRTFKENYGEEQYVRIITQKKYRSAYAKFRCGVAPIKIETCRYGLNRVPVNERLCETCNLVEDEIHVLLHCSMYDDIRDTLFADICNIKRDFCDLTVDSQFILKEHIIYLFMLLITVYQLVYYWKKDALNLFGIYLIVLMQYIKV